MARCQARFPNHRMPRFDIHWCDVSTHEAPGLAPATGGLLALWPAPVNADACFEEAGFSDFEDNDAEWDDNARALLARVVRALSVHGEPRLLSAPITENLPWYSRLFRAPVAVPLLEQLDQPMHWDSVPRCHVAFGAGGATLRTGNGHVLLWITLPHPGAGAAEAFVRDVADGHPICRTPLRWRTLLVAP